MDLEVFHVFDGHFNDFGLFDAASTFLHASWRQQTGQVSQTVIHTIPPSFLDDSV